MVAWLNTTDFGILYNPKKFYGYVAPSPKNPHEFVLAMRGTEGVLVNTAHEFGSCGMVKWSPLSGTR